MKKNLKNQTMKLIDTFCTIRNKKYEMYNKTLF